ncbi:MAG: GAP family protein [Acidimicrobiales bacterium]
MGAAIGQIIANAVGVAISPIPIIAVILMLLSRSAARNSVSFVIGWLVGLAAVTVVVLAVGIESSSDDGADTGGIVQLVVGALFLGLAAKQWRSRPRVGTEPEMPGWMAAIDSLGAAKAFALGLVVTVPNPKNAGLTIAAAVAIAGADLGAGQEAVVVAVYILLASVSVIAPVVFYLATGDRAAPALDATKEWLTANSATVMTVLFTVLGAKVLGNGVAGVF